MAKKSNICASIEGNKISFNTRQFYSKPPYIDPILGVRVYPFKLGINGYAEISSPLDNEAEAAFASSMLKQGDCVQGGSVDGWATKPIKSPEKGVATGAHSAVFGDLKGHAYAHVESPHRDHLQSPDIMARHPEIPQIINPIYKK